jgi:hypothetical protein
MAEHVERNRPVRPRPVDCVKGAASLRSSGSKALMAAQRAVVRSIEETVKMMRMTANHRIMKVLDLI